MSHFFNIMASGGNRIQKASSEDPVEEKFSGRKFASSLDLLAKINDEFLTCQICFETYTSPKSLSCQHTFCKKCLQDYLNPNASALVCPTCRCSQPLTGKGIQELKDNFFISSMSDMLKTVKEISNDDKHGTSLLCDTCDEDCRKSAMSRCLDCTDFLCSECSVWHRRTKLTRRHKIVSLSEFESGIHNKELKSRAKIYCTIHEGEVVKIYCKTCQCPICHECVDSEHSVHTRCLLKEEVLNRGMQIEKLLISAKNKTDALLNMQMSMQDMKQLNKQSRDEAEAKINKTAAIFIDAIERRTRELIEKLDGLYVKGINQINIDYDSVDMQMNSLSSCADFSKQVLEYGTPKEVLGLNNQMTQILQQLLECHPAIKYHEVNQTDQLDFVFNYENLKIINQVFGRIEFDSRPFTENIIKALRRVDVFCVGDSDGESQRKGPLQLTLTPTEAIKTTLLMQIGRQGDGEGEFESTPNLAVNSVGEVMTSDTDSCRIQIFHPQGEFKDSFKTQVNGKQLRPSGIAILRNDDIAVCCEDQVFIWTHEGKTVHGFGKREFINCNSIAVDTKNRIIVTDQAQPMVYIFKSDGTLIHKFDGSNSEGKLVEPRYVTCDAQNNIIVSDAGDCTIKKFDSLGEHVCTFGNEGADKGQFQGPRGVCTDANDNIIVSDCWNHRVDMFTPEGEFTRHILTDSDGLHFPWSIAITSMGRLVLSEDYCWSVKIFSLPDFNGELSSAGSEKNVITSPAVLIRDLGQLGGKFDMSNILNSKLSRWLNSPSANNSDVSQTLKTPSSAEYAKEKVSKRPGRSKSLTSKASLPSDSILTSESIAYTPATVPRNMSTRSQQKPSDIVDLLKDDSIGGSPVSDNPPLLK